MQPNNPQPTTNSTPSQSDKSIPPPRYTAADFEQAFGLRKRGQEFAGPCPRPSCPANDDGFHVRDGAEPGKFGCRGCIDGGQDLTGEHAAEIIVLLKLQRGSSRTPRVQPRRRQARGSFQGHADRECSPYCQNYDFADGRSGHVVEHRLHPDELEKLAGTGKSRRQYISDRIPLKSEPVRTHVAIDLVDGAPVVVTEGPKAAWHVRQHGFGSGSWLGGTGSVGHCDFSRLAGLDVVLWPDAGEAGGKAMVTAGRAVAAIAGSVRWVDVSELADGDDAADVDGPDAIRRMVSNARAWEPPLESARRQHRKTTGAAQRRALARVTTEKPREWVELADVFTEWLRLRVRYDRERAAWWEWCNGSHWRDVSSEATRLSDLIHAHRDDALAELKAVGKDDLVDALINDETFNKYVAGQHREFQFRLRQNLGRPEPIPPPHELGTPGGVVDLRDGSLTPHDPLRHDTLAITIGHYLNGPGEEERLRALLYERLKHNLSAADYAQLLKFWGLGVTRRAQYQASILWLYGLSGSGKGHLVNLTQQAFGRLAATVKLSTFMQARGDIDTDLAEVLERNPLFVSCDEMSGKLPFARVNTLTGNSVWSARRPHGRAITRQLSCLWLFPTVSVPSFDADSGLRRRSRVLGFERAYQGDRNEDFDDNELNAVVSLAIREARAVYRADYEAPEGNVKRLAMLLENADSLAAWLDALPDTESGSTLDDLSDRYNGELGLSERDHGRMNKVKLRKRLLYNPRWSWFTPNGHNSDRRMRIQLRQDAEQQLGLGECQHEYVADESGKLGGAACINCGHELENE